MATTTPNYGWPVPTSTDYVKDGALAIENLGDAIDATVFGLPSAGLTLVKSQVIGSAVSSVTVTAAFSTTYENYKILVANVDASTDDSTISLTVNGTTGNNYTGAYFVFNLTNSTTTSARTNASTSVPMFLTSTDTSSFSCNVNAPFETAITSFTDGAGTGKNYITIGAGGFTLNTNSSTAFTLTASTGTLTGGTIYVYGYKK